MIVLEKVNKIYNQGKQNEVHALKDADLTIQRGAFVAITGPSGSGKSTLLHIISGLDDPSSGKYYFEGSEMGGVKDASKCELRNKQIGIVLQDFGLLGSETVLQNVCLPLIIGGAKSSVIKRKGMSALSMVGISELSNKPVNQLSGGQQQRVAVARAVVTNAKVILADEPTGALDTCNTEALMNLFSELHKNGITIVVVTHNPTVAKRCSTEYSITDGFLRKIR